MDRMKKLSILSTMSDEHLTQALNAVGIDCESEDYMQDLGPEESPGLESWSERSVNIPLTVRSPLVDSSKIFVPKQQPMQPQGMNFVPEQGVEEEAAMAMDMYR